tara:strand:+ start:6996 stop:7280 length:285 start_codon:yes stop_codon:yes gene_type:complete
MMKAIEDMNMEEIAEEINKARALAEYNKRADSINSLKDCVRLLESLEGIIEDAEWTLDNVDYHSAIDFDIRLYGVYDTINNIENVIEELEAEWV